MSFTLHGFEGARRDLRRLKYSVPKSVRRVIGRSAKRLEGRIRAAAPVADGELRDGIQSHVSRSGLTAVVVSTAPHSLHVEGGTRHAPAQPFFFSTAKANAARIRAEIDKAVREGLKK